MFEETLAKTFKEIFAVKKVDYSAISESKEQECLFVDISETIVGFSDGVQTAKVTGKATMNGVGTKLPFGFFAKAIKEAPPALTKDLFFYEIEANKVVYRDVVERGFSFVYFFRSQYDPEIGSITSVNITVEET